jgi:SAM-dependent methyltransferase
MKVLGAFDGIQSVIELGAQAVWCPRRGIVEALFRAFERPPPDERLLHRFASWKGSGRELYEALGFSYRCVDLDPSFGAVRMDLNFDTVPEGEAGHYDFVTNHGTSEHLLNQYNCFKLMHDFCRPGGLFLHAVPFTVHLEHGFFNYQPNFFGALARYNSYETLGIWIGPHWDLASLVPWEKALLDYLVLKSNTTHILVVLQRKLRDAPFRIPFQKVYEDSVPEDALSRYAIVVDGNGLDGYRDNYLGDIPGRQLLEEVRRRIARRILGKLGLGS